MKKIFLILLFAVSVYPQVINRPNRIEILAGSGGGGGAVPVVESFENGSVEGSATIKIKKPSGIQAGDLLIVAVMSEETSGTQQWNSTVNKPSGFTWDSTYVGTDITGTNNSQSHCAVFWDVGTGSEAYDSISVTSVGTNDQVGFFLRISGADTSNPIDASDSPLDTTYYNERDTIQIHAQTTSYNYELALTICVSDGGNEGLTISGTGWSIVDTTWVTDSEYGVSGLIGKKDITSAGSTGIATVTSINNRSKTGFIITIKSD